MRPHVLAGSLAVGIAAANVVRASALVTFAIVVACAVACAAVRDAQARLALLAVGCGAIGLTWGGARLDAIDRSVLIRHEDQSAWTRLVVTAPPRRTTYAVRVFARVERFGEVGLDEPVLAELPRGRSPPQGARVELFAKVRRPRPPTTDFDERAWLQRKGIHVVLVGESWQVVGRRDGLAGIADRLHARLVRTAAPGIGGERRAVVRGVVLGEDEGLDDDLRDAFRASGLYHLLAVSGQNVALLAGGVLGLGWLLGVPRLFGHATVLAAIGAYALAVGWQPSVVRATVAGGLASLAWLTARQRDRWWFFVAGALVLLAWNPYSALEPGFQLSFAAVAAIFIAVPWLGEWLEGYPLPASLRTVLAVSTACGLGTAPIVWLHFGAIPLYSVPANAVAAPVVAPLLGLALGAAALEPFAPGAAAVLAWLNGWCAAYLAGCARAFAALPSAQLTTGRALALVSAVILALVVVPRLRPPRVVRALVLAAMALAAGIAWRGPGPDAIPPPPGLRITVLDVGQGDATLIEVPAGALLVDAGPPEARVFEELRRRGVRELDALVLTHPSRDNIGGGTNVVANLDVAAVFDPQLPFENPFGAPALAAARVRGARVVIARAGQELRLGRLVVSVLWPPDATRRSEDVNDHATVLLATYGEFDALLPADAESNVTSRLTLPDVELYKVAHHGSADPGLSRLLETIEPELAVISVGADNDYGHPAPSTIAALARSGARILRTDRNSAVTIESDGRRMWVRSER